jgi:hypothetical protein
MAGQIWTPGMIGPLDAFVERIRRRTEAFAGEHGLERATVSVELVDGALFQLSGLSAEPGFGFLTLVPHPEADEPAQEVIVPLGAIRQIMIQPSEPDAPGFGFQPGASA